MMTLAQAAEIIRNAYAEIDRTEAQLPDLKGDFKIGAEKRIRVFKHTIRDIYSIFDADDRAKLDEMTRPEPTQKETLF